MTNQQLQKIKAHTEEELKQLDPWNDAVKRIPFTLREDYLDALDARLKLVKDKMKMIELLENQN